jgi:predicted MPP superfamily phosphohydrolase
MLRLVHLSDIHFGGYGPEWDDDEDQREQLVVDVAERIREDEIRADGILVGGDVAYSGTPSEYERAALWLEALVPAAGCPESAVWLVPGNHDVNRKVVEGSHILTDFREAVRGCELGDRAGELDDVLRTRLAQDEAAAGLTEPFKAYNDFAFHFGCSTSSNHVHWKDDSLRLDDSTVLLWGMNSALVSDHADAGGQEGQPNLVLGTYQSKVRALPGEVRIAISHHPPTWLRDWSRVEPYISRSHLVLFGHEHTFKAHQPAPDGTVHVHAGAVGPERGDKWVPSYNILTLRMLDDKLEIVIQPRVWSPQETRFVAHEDEHQNFTLPLDMRTLQHVAEPEEAEEKIPTGEEPAAATPLAPEASSAEEGGVTQEGAMEPARVRALAVAYLSAAETRRLEIAQRLGVLRDEDLTLPDEAERYGAILTRIRDEGLIGELGKELNL